MNKLGHILFATLVFVALYVIVSNNMPIQIEKVLLGYFIFIIYTLLPDIDKNNSWIRKQLDKIIIILLLFFTTVSIVNNDKTALIIAAILLVAEIVLTIIKHRGPIHSTIFGIIISAPLLLIDPFYFFTAFLGVLTHLIADKI
jgi:hypothetical protein